MNNISTTDNKLRTPEFLGDMDNQSHWYLMQMKAAQHYRGLNNLLGRGYECFSPDITLKKRRRGKTVNVTEPLFPGYVFIKLARNCNWQSVGSTRGVARFIRFGAYPTVVPEQTIESINQNLEQSRDFVARANELRPGDKVIINDEGFSEFEAVFKCKTSQNRSIILIKHLEQVHEVYIKNEKLKLVKAM